MKNFLYSEYLDNVNYLYRIPKIVNDIEKFELDLSKIFGMYLVLDSSESHVWLEFNIDHSEEFKKEVIEWTLNYSG